VGRDDRVGRAGHHQDGDLDHAYRL
jgi:hypothetical protein